MRKLIAKRKPGKQDGNETILEEASRKFLVRNLIVLKWNVILYSEELLCYTRNIGELTVKRDNVNEKAPEISVQTCTSLTLLFEFMMYVYAKALHLQFCCRQYILLNGVETLDS